MPGVQHQHPAEGSLVKVRVRGDTRVVGRVKGRVALGVFIQLLSPRSILRRTHLVMASVTVVVVSKLPDLGTSRTRSGRRAHTSDAARTLARVGVAIAIGPRVQGPSCHSGA